MKPIRSILTAGIVLAALSTSLLALTLPVSEDSSTSASTLVARAAGKGSTLSVSSARQGLVRFEAGAFADSISAADVSAARLVIFISGVSAPGPLTLHRITQDWSEHGASVPAYDTHPLATIPAASVIAKQFVIIDVTAAVQAWLQEPGSDFGFAIASADGARVLLGAKEGPAAGHPAQLQIETGGTHMNTDEGGRTRASATAPIGNFVTNLDIMSNSIKGKKIKDGTLFGTKLALATVTADRLAPTIGLWTAAGANVVRATGKVGIDTLTPLATLDIATNDRADDGKPAMIIGPSASFHVEFDAEQIQAGSKFPAKDNPSDLLLNFNGGNVLVGSTMSVGGIATFGANVGVGTTTPDATNGRTLEVSGTDGSALIDTNYGGGPAIILGRKANGTPAAPTALQAGDEIAYFSGRGHTGAGFSPGSRAIMIYSASENWTGTANGAEIAFGTTPNGSISRAERMRIANNGRVGIATSTPLAPLHVSIGSNISLGQPALIVGEAINTGGIAQGQHLEFDRLGIQAGSGFPASANLVNTLSLNSQGGSVTVNNQAVATGEESLRIVRGGVTAAGARDKGVGFTSVRSSTGIYVISFTTSFSDIPSITGSVRQNTDFIVSVGNVTANSATIFVNNVSNANVDAPLDFIVAGPR